MHRIRLTWPLFRFALKTVANHWHIQAGTAQTWVAPGAGRLFVVSGRVWASCDSPCGPATDHMLLAGDDLTVCVGQRVVLEPWARGTHDEVFLRWLPA